jgi:predicted amidohydrolase
MREFIKVAAISAGSRPGETPENLAMIGDWCRRAAEERAQVALFPELSLTGFIPNHPVGDHAEWLRQALSVARRVAEPLTGTAVEQLKGIAADCGLAVVAGMLEDAGNRLFNTQVMAWPDGQVFYWRKMHIPMFEMPFYNGGGIPAVAETALGRLGANICFDALLPESTRLLAVQNAEVVLFPFAADPAIGWSEWALPSLRARCVENGVFGVACNYAGEVTCGSATQVFPGGAAVVGPRGELIAERTGAGMLLATLPAADLQAARAEPEYLFRFRRPELYGTLAV